MRILIALFLGFAVSVPIQQKSVYEMGTEIYVGTPAHRYFVGVDFMSTDLRLFAGPGTRSMFVPPVADSSSLRRARRGPGLVDNVTFAGVHFDNVGVNLLTDRTVANLLHCFDSYGVLGLGPQSRFALERIIALREVNIAFNATDSRKGFDLELVHVLPEMDHLEHEEIAVPVFEAGEGWMTNATVKVGRFTVSSGIVQFDPASKDIEIPLEAVNRLVVVLKMQSPEVALEDGFIVVPCDAESLITINQDIIISVGESELLVQPNRRGVRATDGRCKSQFKLNVRFNEIRINPFLVGGLKRVFFDAAERAITFRIGDKGDHLADVLPPIDLPMLPSFGEYSLTLGPPKKASLTLKPATEGLRYYPLYRFPLKANSGRSVFIFASINAMGDKGSERLPGRYKMRGDGSLRIHADSSISLPLLRVANTDRSSNTYAISIERSPGTMLIVLEPPSVSVTVPEIEIFESVDREYVSGRKIAGM